MVMTLHLIIRNHRSYVWDVLQDKLPQKEALPRSQRHFRRLTAYRPPV